MSTSAFGVEHGEISKARKDLVPAEGRPSKYTRRIEDVRAARGNRFPKPGVHPAAVAETAGKIARKVR